METEVGKSAKIGSIVILLAIMLIFVVIDSVRNGYNYIYTKGYNAGRDSTRLHIAKIQSDTSKVTCKPINDE